MMETKGKQAANSKGTVDTIIPQRLPKTIFLSILRERCQNDAHLVERVGDRRPENHSSTARSL